MAETQNEKSSKAHIKKSDEDLPPPPPPPPQDSAPAPAFFTGNQDSNPLPLPPPKESFSKFYQQRQVNELKRLYRHMHPELRKNLEEAVSEDLADMLNADDPGAQASANLDAVLPGEVQSMRWIFENWTLDSIGEHQATKKLTEEEAIPNGDVKNRSMRFESQPFNKDRLLVSDKASEKAKGDVHTARWLFETQPLDSLNKLYLDETDLQEAVLKEPVQSGDVKGAAQLFETHSLDALGRCSSVEEQNILQLKSEIQELKGSVKKTIKLFQTEPLCAIRDKTGNIHEIKSVCREEIQSNAVKTARWLFETQPLDMINKDTSKVQVLRGISLEEAAKGNVSGAKWIFETQPLDAIREFTVEETDFKASPDLIQGADVSKQCHIFETQPLDTLKGETSDSIPAKQEVVKGNVKSTLWLFETQPMETLKDNFEVGHLQKVELSDEEKGAVRQTKHVFETCPLGSISKSPPEDSSVTNVQAIEKGDVKAFKSLFETLPLDSIRQASTEEMVREGEKILPGNVKANQFLFETTPLYAIKDCFGNFHKVTSVSREEEVVGGDVKNYKWMFETKPLDQFDDSVQKVDIIRGITKQEVMAGDVKTAKWLFETQPIDVIHNQINQAEQKVTEKGDSSQGGDVKTCRWLFETQPMDTLYEKEEKQQDEEEPVPRADVKSCTWMFETQPLDSLKGREEQCLQVSKAYRQDESQGVDVKMVRHVFETEPLINDITSDTDSKKIIRYSSRVEMQSGKVSRVKEFFEAKPLDSADKSSTAMKGIDIPVDGNIELGAVHKFTWLFENCPMDTLKSSEGGIQEVPPQKDIQGGDVGGKIFVFETYSLDQIHDKENEKQIKTIQEETMNKASVKSCMMLFETQPLYAIQDRDGGYHEVTSVKKEEIMKGDVKGARWQFETKPLDQIKKDEEVFVIRAVTQEDFKKGNVQTARWRFETEPLDSITDEKRPVLRTVDDVPKVDVQSNKQLFESEQMGQKKYVRMVSVSDVQQGDVRTSTWLFENQPIDSLRGESEITSSLTTVQREDIAKGDVKRCTWLFETQPMDSLKDTEASANAEPQEVVPQANVKSTTWLFESTPLDKLSTSQHCTEMEVRERTIKDTLEVLLSHQVIQHDGILIEANDTESVKMAKYQLDHQGAPEIQKEEVMRGNLQRILMQLLQRTNVETQGVLVQEEESGNIKISAVQLLNSDKVEKSKEELSDNVAKALREPLSQDASAKKGIIMQETRTGSAKITIYSLFHHVAQHQEFVKGDVKSTIGNLLASSQEQRATATIKREENERGNVQLYTSCIEKGDLDYLKNLQRESEIESLVSSQAKEQPLKTVQEVKLPAQLQEEKIVMTTAADIVLGHSDGAKQAFVGESKEGTLEREAVCASDLGPPPHCLVQSPSSVIAKEKVVSGNVNLPTQAAQKAQNGSHRVVREEKMIMGNRKQGTITTNRVANQKDATAAHCSTVGEINQMTAQPKTQALGSDLQAAMQNLRLATAEAKSLQHQVQSKLQKTTEKIQLGPAQPQAAVMQTTVHKEDCVAAEQQQASNVTFIRVQNTSKPHANVSRKIMTSHAKVSASEEVQGGTLPPAACQDGHVVPSADLSVKDGLYTAKPVKSYVNPFIESDYKEHSVPEEREQDVIIRGDVKTAIRALQTAATEQRQVDKEDVVRGNLKATLESLEKSNVNVSKGDFKAAMIYRNAGQSYPSCKKKNEAHSVSSQAADIAASGSQAVNDFPPPPPASASVMTECDSSSTKPREAEAVGHYPPLQPHVPKTLSPSPAKPSGQKPLEKPQVPPKPDAVAPPRKKPVPPPKPGFLLKEVVPHPPCCKKGQSEKAAAPPSPLTPPAVIEQSKSKASPINQTKAPGGAEAWEPSACRQHSTDCPAPPSPVATVVKDISSEKKAMKDVVKTPLQVAEENYKAKKKEQSKVEVVERKSSSEVIKNGSVGCEGRDCHPTKEIQGSVESCQQENGCVLPGRQDTVLSLGCQTGLPNLEGQRKPYLSAKCQANILRKGTITTHASSSKMENTSTLGASKNNQRTTPRAQEEASEAAVSASSSAQSKQFFKGHQFVNSKGLGEPEMKNEQDTEKEKQAVVMRGKACRETEDERWKRLSVHKEEIMKGNVKEAMEIFENLRRQEELQEILTRVKEFEGETSKVDVKALRSLFENVPEWVVYHKTHQTKQPKVEKAEQTKEVREDVDSVSSVELAFEDLERASAEIIHLKEQTLSRLLDIEEAIRKALYSISSLKSESDIAGLSGLLKESLGSSQSLAAGNNIRKISIVSSKAKQEKGMQNSSWEDEKGAEKHEMPKVELEVPCIIQPRASSPFSPLYISIQSAARKTAESPKMVHSSASNYMERATTERDTFTKDIFSSLPRKSVRSDGCNLAFSDSEQERIKMTKGGSLIKQQCLSSPEHLQHQLSSNGDKERDMSQSLIQAGVSDYASKGSVCTLSPSNPRRQKSILELQTSHDGSKLYGATRTVTEQYEEVDQFGNKIITSSTTVTKQSETQTSSTCDMVSCPTRYEVTASPILRKYLNSPVEDFHSNGGHQETGVVFVTFSNSKPGKK
ncbi:xin actin-binding repeat-containing protein 1 [Rhineura floridana]|uniref:xin actin-binding repeat-containing protein 1 n=1 Tax=Rhineura floridana TaxID=261503 RepID=UPI002AC86B81|nr:xin actin-binding repeat-containing protein 1 [Rhineura floridana]